MRKSCVGVHVCVCWGMCVEADGWKRQVWGSGLLEGAGRELGLRCPGGPSLQGWEVMVWQLWWGCGAAMYNVPRGSSIVALGWVGKMLGSHADFLDLIQCEDE